MALAAFKQFYRSRWQRWLSRRIPREREVVLNQRRIFIFLSRQGLLASAMITALFIGGINYANNLLLGLCFFIASVFVVAIHHTYANLSGLRITAVSVANTFAGEAALFTLRFADVKERTHDSLLLEWEGEQVVLPKVANPQEMTIALPVHERGWYRPARFKLSTTYPLGWLRAWTWLDMDLTALVYPKPEPSEVVPAGAGKEGEGEKQRTLGQEDFEGLKRFVAGDSLAHISWKHLARGQGLQTKQYAAEEAGSEVLDWDALSGMTIEKRLSRLTWWVVKFSQAQQPFGLRIPGHEFPVDNGQAHQEACLKALALFGREQRENTQATKTGRTKKKVVQDS